MPKYTDVDDYFKQLKEDPTLRTQANMSPENIKRLQEILSLTKIKLILRKDFRFLTKIMFRLDFVWSNEIETAAAGGKYLLMNPDFFDSMSINDRIFILCHELWHIALRHNIRGVGKDHNIFNIACDFAINIICRDAGLAISALRNHGCYDTKYRNMSSEQIYFELMEKVKKDCPGSYLQIIGGKSSSDLTEEEQKAIKKAIGAPANTPFPSDVIPIKDPAGANTTEANEIDNLIAAAYQSMTDVEKQAGTMPGELQLFIDQFFNPKLPWYRILAQYLNSFLQDDYSLRRPNRRFGSDPFMKGRTGTSGLDQTYFFLDTSGSISDEEIKLFNSEVHGIKKMFNPEEMRIITFDTKLHEEYIIDRHETYKSIKVSGRGGTDLHKVFEKINQDRPDVAVIFTDLCVDIPAEKPKSPIIWIALNNPNKPVPFGKVVYFNTD